MDTLSAVPIPCTNGQALTLDVARKFIAHAVIREKVLKIFQYLSRLAGYMFRKWSLEVGGFNAPHFFALNKQLSTARRFYKFLRCLKHFGDIPDAKAEKAARLGQKGARTRRF